MAGSLHHLWKQSAARRVENFGPTKIELVCTNHSHLKPKLSGISPAPKPPLVTFESEGSPALTWEREQGPCYHLTRSPREAWLGALRRGSFSIPLLGWWQSRLLEWLLPCGEMKGPPPEDLSVDAGAWSSHTVLFLFSAIHMQPPRAHPSHGSWASTPPLSL